MGGLASLAIKDYTLRIYVCQSRIMQFLYLKLFFEFAGKPVFDKQYPEESANIWASWGGGIM